MRLKVLSLLAAGLTLSACASTAPSSAPYYGQRDALGLPQPMAERETVRVEMPVDPLDNGLSWAQQDLLDAVANEYKSRGHGPLVISYPEGSEHEDLALDVISDARAYLYERGLNWRQLVGAPYDGRSRPDAPVVFSFARYVAEIPDCNQVWEPLALEFDNRRPDRFGCAMAANLAVMVANPRDLIEPRDQGSADLGRRTTVLEAYRAGQPTASTRSDSENGAVSRVGN